jgi:hypothetical protein
MTRLQVRSLSYAGCLIGMGVLVVASGRAQNAEQPAAASKLAQSAKAALEAATTMYAVGQADAEDVYRWSRRLVDAELQAGAGRKAALQHVARMRQLNVRVEALHRAGVEGGEELRLHATAYYVEEAQLIALQHAQP